MADDSIQRSSADCFEHFRSGRLAFVGLAQFAGKPTISSTSSRFGTSGAGVSFGALRSLGPGVFRRRSLVSPPLAPERLFIATPMGLEVW
jgi:hypothetical protein